MQDDLVTYVNAFFTVYIIIIFVRILMSWVPVAPVKPITRALYDFVHQTTGWFLNFFRRIIPPIGFLDLSPIVALIVIFIARALVINLINSF